MITTIATDLIGARVYVHEDPWDTDTPKRPGTLRALWWSGTQLLALVQDEQDHHIYTIEMQHVSVSPPFPGGETDWWLVPPTTLREGACALLPFVTRIMWNDPHVGTYTVYPRRGESKQVLADEPIGVSRAGTVMVRRHGAWEPL